MKSKSTETKLEKRIVMKKLHGVVTLTVTVISATLLVQTALKVAAAPASTGIKNVVLVHGAFADGSGWEAVANILSKDGYTVSVVQHPETSFAEDVKFTKAEIDRQSGPVVLVGHSYGGAVITEAGNDPKVAALVYIAAFAPDTGESAASLEQAVPPAGKGIKENADGYFYIDPASFAADFCADIPKTKAEFMAK
jgi:pimeloyl-ACP methyl ester carboxylesterase